MGQLPATMMYCHNKANSFEPKVVFNYTVSKLSCIWIVKIHERLKWLADSNLQQQTTATFSSTCFRTPWEEGDIMHSEANQIQDPESFETGVSWWPIFEDQWYQCTSSSQATVSKRTLWEENSDWSKAGRLGQEVHEWHWRTISGRFRQNADFFENGKSEQTDENSKSRWEFIFQLAPFNLWNLWSIFLATTVALPQRQETQARQRYMQKRTSAVAAV